MASTNQSPFYQKAEARFLEAQTDQERITALEEMIKECPKHKSSEKMLANLKTRYKKLLSKIEKSKKSGKSSHKGIKKGDMQAVIVGLTNSGKSSLLSLLTKAKPIISEVRLSTIEPIIGILNYKGVQIQLIENPSIESEYFDKGIIHTADTILVLINDLKEIEKINSLLKEIKILGEKIILLNNLNKNKNELKKIKATLKSKKHNFLIIDLKNQENLEELKEKIFSTFPKIRIYTKEPRKEKSKNPIILKKDSIVKDVAEKILKGFSQTIKQTKIWGPSSKFPGQIIGLKHKLKDLDVVEFKTK